MPGLTMFLFAVFDVKAGAYLRPFCAESLGLAARSFGDAVNDPAHQMSRHAEDYTLFALGTFDTVTGVVTSKIEVVGTALAFKRDALEGLRLAQ